MRCIFVVDLHCSMVYPPILARAVSLAEEQLYDRPNDSVAILKDMYRIGSYIITTGKQNRRMGLCVFVLDLSLHGHNDRLYADDIFRFIFVNEKFFIENSLKFVPKALIDNTFPATYFLPFHHVAIGISWVFWHLCFQNHFKRE